MSKDPNVPIIELKDVEVVFTTEPAQFCIQTRSRRSTR